MTLLEAIELVQSRAPAEITGRNWLRCACLEQNPTAHTLLGGQEKCAAFMHAVETALSRPAVAHAVAIEVQPITADSSKRHSLRGIEIAALGLFVIVAIGGFFWYALDGFQSSNAAPAQSQPEKSTTAAVPPAQPKPSPSPVVKAPTAKTLKPVAGLARQVGPGRTRQVEWLDHQAHGGRTGGRRKSDWDVTDPRNPRPELFLITGAHEVQLASQQEITPDKQWLQVRVASITPGVQLGQIEIRDAGKPLARFDVPPWGGGHRFAVSLQDYVGRSVRLELVHLPRSRDEQIQWREIRQFARPARVEWTNIKPESVQSSDGATLTIAADGAVIAGGPNPNSATYDVTLRWETPGVTALRIEAQGDPARFHNTVPGGRVDGRFMVSHVSAVSGTSREQAAQLHGRYVRVELPGPNRAITLAEVQVMAGTQNVAVGKAASQSSTLYDTAPAGKAVDGNNSGRTRHGSMTFTKAENDPWWEVDLGSEQAIDGIRLFTRASTPWALTNHRMVVLSAGPSPVWKFQNRDMSTRDLSYGPFLLNQDPVDFALAAASGDNDPASMEHIIGTISPTHGWSGGGSGTPESLVLTFQPGQPLAGKFVSLRLQHRSHHAGQNLGRFRISQTTAPPPIPAETPVTIVPRIGK